MPGSCHAYELVFNAGWAKNGGATERSDSCEGLIKELDSSWFALKTIKHRAAFVFLNIQVDELPVERVLHRGGTAPTITACQPIVSMLRRAY